MSSHKMKQNYSPTVLVDHNLVSFKLSSNELYSDKSQSLKGANSSKIRNNGVVIPNRKYMSQRFEENKNFKRINTNSLAHLNPIKSALTIREIYEQTKTQEVLRQITKQITQCKINKDIAIKRQESNKIVSLCVSIVTYPMFNRFMIFIIGMNILAICLDSSSF